MKYSIYVSQYTQKLQTLAYIEKKSINLKKDTKEYLQSSLKQKKKKKSIYPLIVPGQQSALIRNQTSSESWSK